MNMTIKRLAMTLGCMAGLGLLFPGAVFGGGKSDKKDSGSKPPQDQGSGTPIETNLQDPEVATIQLAPAVARETIFRGQLVSEVDRMEKAARRALTIEEKRGVLDVMINERLAVQAAKQENISVSDNEVNQQLQQMRFSMVQAIGRQPTDAEFAQALRNETGMTEDAFKDQIRRQLTIQKYLLSKKRNLFESIKIPSEEEIRAAFTERKASFVRPETVRFSMIQVPYGADAAARTRAKTLADRLVREIGSDPAKFDEVVLRGQASNSGYQAGDGGLLPRTDQVQEIVGQPFINAAFALRQGQVSRLIEGNPGFQIIKITETYGRKDLALDDIFQIGTTMTVRDYIGNALLQQRQQVILAQASQELVAELRTGKTYQINEKNLVW